MRHCSQFIIKKIRAVGNLLFILTLSHAVQSYLVLVIDQQHSKLFIKCGAQQMKLCFVRSSLKADPTDFS